MRERRISFDWHNRYKLVFRRRRAVIANMILSERAARVCCGRCISHSACPPPQFVTANVIWAVTFSTMAHLSARAELCTHTMSGLQERKEKPGAVCGNLIFR